MRRIIHLEPACPELAEGVEGPRRSPSAKASAISLSGTSSTINSLNKPRRPFFQMEVVFPGRISEARLCKFFKGNSRQILR